MRRLTYMLWCVLMLVTYGGSNSTYADNSTIYVSSAESIQAAIGAAQNGNTVLVADGTYYETDLDFHGKAITVRSKNGPDNCIIDCENAGCAFYFHTGEGDASILEGFTIQNAYVSADSGGAIYCEHTSPVIIRCIIKDNEAIGLNGIITCEGEPEHTSMPKIIDCLIVNNSIDTGVGGGIWLKYSDASIINCTITGNKAVSGGGLYCEASNPKMINTILWGNSSPGGGNELGTDRQSNVTVSYCNIRVSAVSGNWTNKEHNIDSDPLFVNSAAGDYHLKLSSLCIDSGKDSAAYWTSDIDNKSRTKNVIDIGAYEFQGGLPGAVLRYIPCTVNPNNVRPGTTKGFSAIVANYGVESVKLSTGTVFEFGAFKAKLVGNVTVVAGGSAKFAFSNSKIAHNFSFGSYLPTIKGKGEKLLPATGSFSQAVSVTDMITVVKDLLVIDASNSPYIVRGDCDFEDVEIAAGGKMLFEGAQINARNVTVKVGGGMSADGKGHPGGRRSGTATANDDNRKEKVE